MEVSEELEEPIDLNRQLLAADADTLRRVAEHEIRLATESAQVQVLQEELWELEDVARAQEGAVVLRRFSGGKEAKEVRFAMET